MQSEGGLLSVILSFALQMPCNTKKSITILHNHTSQCSDAEEQASVAIGGSVKPFSIQSDLYTNELYCQDHGQLFPLSSLQQCFSFACYIMLYHTHNVFFFFFFSSYIQPIYTKEKQLVVDLSSM